MRTVYQQVQQSKGLRRKMKMIITLLCPVFHLLEKVIKTSRVFSFVLNIRIMHVSPSRTYYSVYEEVQPLHLHSVYW